jgi:hypothetical protein
MPDSNNLGHYNMRQNMPQGFATRVYDVLVEVCGARDGDFDRLNFTIEYERCTRPNGPASEHRFSGNLAFGGKFRYPGMTVDCYREDETPATLKCIEKANARLALLKQEMQAGNHNAPARSGTEPTI